MPLLSIMTRRDFGPLLDAEIEFLQENHEKAVAVGILRVIVAWA